MQIQVTTKAELGKSTRLWDLARCRRILKYFSAALAVCVQPVCWIQAPIAIIASWNYQVLDCPTEGKAGWRGAHCFLRRFTYSLFFAQVHIIFIGSLWIQKVLWLKLPCDENFNLKKKKVCFQRRRHLRPGWRQPTLLPVSTRNRCLGYFFSPSKHEMRLKQVHAGFRPALLKHAPCSLPTEAGPTLFRSSLCIFGAQKVSHLLFHLQFRYAYILKAELLAVPIFQPQKFGGTNA